MKTARITLLVEYDKEAPTGAFSNRPALDGETAARMDIVPVGRSASLWKMHDSQILGTPRVELDKRPRCSISEAQFHAAISGMRERGGAFARSLAETLAYADSSNCTQLLDTFHDLIWGYVPDLENT
jgi:hypothetical protein